MGTQVAKRKSEIRRIVELELLVEELEKRIKQLEQRPEPHNPFRPIGPRPGVPPWGTRPIPRDPWPWPDPYPVQRLE